MLDPIAKVRIEKTDEGYIVHGLTGSGLVLTSSAVLPTEPEAFDLAIAAHPGLLIEGPPQADAEPHVAH